jgi:hypothetical protein
MGGIFKIDASLLPSLRLNTGLINPHKVSELNNEQRSPFYRKLYVGSNNM